MSERAICGRDAPRGGYTAPMGWRLVPAAWMVRVVVAGGRAGSSEAVSAADAPPATGPPRLWLIAVQ